MQQPARDRVYQRPESQFSYFEKLQRLRPRGHLASAPPPGFLLKGIGPGGSVWVPSTLPRRSPRATPTCGAHNGTTRPYCRLQTSERGGSGGLGGARIDSYKGENAVTVVIMTAAGTVAMCCKTCIAYLHFVSSSSASSHPFSRSFLHTPPAASNTRATSSPSPTELWRQS